MTEPYDLTDAELNKLAKGVGRQSVTTFDVETLWRELSPEDQARISVLAVAAIYARSLRGDACGQHDALYETLEMQTFDMLYLEISEHVPQLSQPQLVHTDR